MKNLLARLYASWTGIADHVGYAPAMVALGKEVEAALAATAAAPAAQPPMAHVKAQVHEGLKDVVSLFPTAAPTAQPVEPSDDARDAQLRRMARCLGFFASVIKSGEPWTVSCQAEYDEALSTKEAPL